MDFDQRQARGGLRARPPHVFERPGSDIKKSGYLKKLKTNKKKYFVLRSTSSSGPARLEYHDSEKKFKAGHLPKRSIQLHTCFNINRQAESRHCRNGVVLYTNEDSFVVLAESLEDQEAWLSVMLEYQYEYLPNGDEHRDHYEHVWSVLLLPKGLGNKSCEGQCRVCLNSTSVSLIKISSSKPQCIIQLPTIRNIAQSKNSFCMEVGKYAPTGEGKFYFQADDVDIVKDMHSTLHHYMNNMADPNLKKDTSFRARSESHSSMSPNHRRPSKVDQRPASFYTSGTTSWRSSMDTTSPGSVSSFGPADHLLGSHRPRSDTGDSRISRGSSQHEDGPHDFFITSYKNGDMHDSMKTKELNVVPPDMPTPPSPKMFEEQLSAYLEMDASLHSNHSAGSNSMGLHHNASVSSQGSSYMAMSPHSQSSSVKGDLSPSLPDSSPSTGSSYMAMAVGGGNGGGSHFGGHVSAPIPIHPHVASHPPHPTPLPTVREGGSNEGYLPMDVTSSPSTPSNLRPEPVKCMLSLDDSSSMTGLPPRTYSLGSKPVGKKYLGYMDMGVGGGASGGGGPRKGSLNSDNMLRATSAPHIIHKGRRDRDRDRDHGGTDSPIPSPLSMSIKSDDSDSFMEYMPMRPRTASDSFNYRPRTSSQGKLQPMCRPRSSSHGQGTRPVTKFSNRISQDAMLHRGASRESSLHDSFDSLRVSNESLRRMSQDLRHSPVVNVSEQGEMMRGGGGSTPPPPQYSGRNNNNSSSSGSGSGSGSASTSGKELVDSYMSMDLAANLHHHHKSSSSSSPHRIRTDSCSSGSLRPDFLTSSQDSEYTEMTPHVVGHGSRSGSYSSGSKVGGGGGGGDDYMNMAVRRPTPSPVLSTSLQSPSVLSDANYVNMELDFAAGGGGGNGGNGVRRTDSVRSASVENVDSYIMYDPAPFTGGSKLRTGSVGSKDKKVSLRVSASTSKKSSSHYQQPPTVSASTKKGGSSDSIRKPTRQSSMEKYGSLGKDFRKKSGSTGSRPMNVSKMSGSGSSSSSGGGAGAGGGGGGSSNVTGDSHYNHMGFNLVPIRKSTTPVSLSARVGPVGQEGGAGGGGGGSIGGGGSEVDLDDEYVEFSPNAYRDTNSSSGSSSNTNCDSAVTGMASSTASSSSSVTGITNPALAPGIHIQSPSLSLPSSSSFSLSSSLSAATTIVTTISGTPAGIPLSHHQRQSSLNDDDYTPFAPAAPNTAGSRTTATMTSNASTAHHHHQPTTRSHNESDYTPFAPASVGQNNDSDYTPFAPASVGQNNDSDYTPFAPAGQQNDSDYTPFAPAGQQNDSDYTPFAPAGQQNDSDYTPFAPAGQQNESDYTPFAPAGGAASSIPHYNPALHKSSSSSSSLFSSSSSSKHPTSFSSTKKQPQPALDSSSDYVGYDPSPRPIPTGSSTPGLGHQLQASSNSFHSTSDLLSRHKNPKVQQQHSSFDLTSRPDSGGSSSGGGSRSATSSSCSSVVHTSTSLTFDPPVQHHPLSSMTSSSSSPSPNQPASLSSSTSSTTPSSSSSSASSMFNPSPLTFSYAAPQPKKTTMDNISKNDDENEYLNFNPAVITGSSVRSSGVGCSSSSSSSSGGGGGGSLVKATSLIRSDDQTAKKSISPLAVDVTTSSSSLLSSSSSPSPSPSTLSKNQRNSSNNNNENNRVPPSTKLEQQQQNEHHHLQQQHPHPPPSSPLSCITTTHLSNSNTATTNGNNNNSKNKNISQMSSPSNCHSSPSPSPQPPSPLPTVSENNPPWSNSTTAVSTTNSSSSTSTRQKHSSGSSTSSQKSRRISGDSSSENLNNGKPLRKSSKSDSNSSLSSSSGSKNSNNNSGGRRRAPSGDKTPQSGSAEKSPLLSPSSRSNEEFFSGSPSLCSGKSLEAKMVPVESKIRHSVGDVATSSSVSCNSSNSDIGGSGSGSGGSGDSSGLFRPGSTPCFQQMDAESSSSSGDNICRLSGGGGSGSGSGSSIIAHNSESEKSSSSLAGHQGGASRSRHSLSDLGAYQQMSVGGGGACMNENSGGSSGSGDSCGSGSNLSSSQGSNLHAGSGTGSEKPLNYAQLDLSASGSGSGIVCGSGGGGGGGGSSGGLGSSCSGGGNGSEVKPRNLSDGDERQPPLSYAKIDFVKSQNLNKAMGYGGSGGVGGGSGGDSNVSKT